jgi:PAS domain S-box-containing protein
MHTREEIKQHTLDNKDLLELLVCELEEFAIVLADTRGTFISWHPGIQAYFGYSAEEFIGQRFELLLPSSERGMGIAERELEMAAKEGCTSDTRWLAKKDGERILVVGVTRALRNPAGELAGFGKVLRDVTALYLAENRLQALTRALDQSNVVVRHKDGTIQHWTAGCERLFGWSAEEAIGQRAHELLQTAFPIPLEQIYEQLHEKGTWSGELKHVRRDGTPVFVSTTWNLHTEGDQPVVIETCTDITGRLEVQHRLEAANRRLQEMARELERSNEELEEFARIASHDLSAPITSTRWLVDALRMRHGSKLDADGQELLQHISQSLERMSDMVDAVLAHARVGTSAIGTPEATDAEEALAVAIDNLRRDIELSGARITHDPLPRLPIDPQALTQLFQNLLSNAVKYRRHDVPLTIHITVSDEGSLWKIGVHDNGIGVEPEWFERIFQPFQRRGGLEIAGTGIGLATCKKIVTRAGGRIWVESQPGKGSSFYFTVPKCKEE